MKQLIAAAAVFVSLACSNPLASGRQDVVLYISDIVVPSLVSSTGQFVATVTVVTGGCKQFERFEVTTTANLATIKAKGTDAGGSSVCTTDIRYEKKTVELSGPFSDPLTIKAIQPDATFLLKTVRVQ